MRLAPFHSTSTRVTQCRHRHCTSWPCRRKGPSWRAAQSSYDALLARYDGDGDGKLTREEVLAVLAAVAQDTSASRGPAKVAGPQGWDASLQDGLQHARSQGWTHLFGDLIQTKLVKPITRSVPASDVVYSFMGMFVSVLLLGYVSAHVRELPGAVGEWHRRGLNLMLGSFGTICVLLFARPDSEAIRVWNLIVGHTVSVAAVVFVMALLGPGMLSRALAMAVALGAMLLTDSVHPPGGALILMAEDSAVIQSMQGWFLLWPSLTLTIAILLPIGALVNTAKRHWRFDWPWKEQQATQQQQASQTEQGEQQRRAQAAGTGSESTHEVQALRSNDVSSVNEVWEQGKPKLA